QSLVRITTVVQGTVHTFGRMGGAITQGTVEPQTTDPIPVHPPLAAQVLQHRGDGGVGGLSIGQGLDHLAYAQRFLPPPEHGHDRQLQGPKTWNHVIHVPPFVKCVAAQVLLSSSLHPTSAAANTTASFTSVSYTIAVPSSSSATGTTSERSESPSWSILPVSASIARCRSPSVVCTVPPTRSRRRSSDVAGSFQIEVGSEAATP